MSEADEIYPCVGICMPDADEAYCIGCGRPWGQPVTAVRQPAPAPSVPESQAEPPPA